MDASCIEMNAFIPLFSHVVHQSMHLDFVHVFYCKEYSTRLLHGIYCPLNAPTSQALAVPTRQTFRSFALPGKSTTSLVSLHMITPQCPNDSGHCVSSGLAPTVSFRIILRLILGIALPALLMMLRSNTQDCQCSTCNKKSYVVDRR